LVDVTVWNLVIEPSVIRSEESQKAGDIDIEVSAHIWVRNKLPATIVAMENENSATGSGPTMRDLYPALTKDELKEAEANFRRYLEIAVRVQNEQCSAGRGNFDTSPILISMKERSKFSLKN